MKRTAIVSRPSFAASTAQRHKVAGRVCAHCGQAPCDPAHLTPRARGGCNHPDCVIPLCRACHRRFDADRRIDLAPVLASPEFAVERAHMASHMSFPECLHRLTGVRWAPEAALYEGWMP